MQTCNQSVNRSILASSCKDIHFLLGLERKLHFLEILHQKQGLPYVITSFLRNHALPLDDNAWSPWYHPLITLINVQLLHDFLLSTHTMFMVGSLYFFSLQIPYTHSLTFNPAQTPDVNDNEVHTPRHESSFMDELIAEREARREKRRNKKYLPKAVKPEATFRGLGCRGKSDRKHRQFENGVYHSSSCLLFWERKCLTGQKRNERETCPKSDIDTVCHLFVSKRQSFEHQSP